MVDNWSNRLQALLLPFACQLCSSEGAAGMDLCDGCRAGLSRIVSGCRRCGLPLPEGAGTDLCGACIAKPPPFTGAQIPYLYEETIIGLVHRLKFGRDLKAGRLLGELLARHLLGVGSLGVEAILPVPMHPSHLRRRGFNQAIEIARPVVKRLQLPLELSLCRRTKATTPQRGLHARDRRRNVRNAFEIRGASPYRRIAILDDVVTTGATAQELAKTLLCHGVEQVEIWAVARAVRH